MGDEMPTYPADDDMMRLVDNWRRGIPNDPDEVQSAMRRLRAGFWQMMDETFGTERQREKRKNEPLWADETGDLRKTLTEKRKRTVTLGDDGELVEVEG